MNRSRHLTFDRLEGRELQSVSLPTSPYPPTTVLKPEPDPITVLKQKTTPIDMGPPGKFTNPGIILP